MRRPCARAAGFVALLAAFTPHRSAGQLVPNDAQRPAFLERDADYYVFDPVAGHVHRPNAKRERAWPEHPRGFIIMATNNLGFREDEPTAAAKPPGVKRVLLTGDSHIDGVVYNAESIATRLEERLNGRPGGAPRAEVINGGAGFYGPYNYRGFFEKYAALAPDLCVVVLYTGNDFTDALTGAERAGELRLPERPPGYFEALRATDALLPGVVPQGFNQIYFFRTFPHLADQAVDVAAHQLRQIQTQCARGNARLLVALLPTKMDAEWNADAARLAQARERLALTDADLAINRRLTARLQTALAAAGVPCVDLLERMRQEGNDRELFWRGDYHLNVRGHDLAAQVVFETTERDPALRLGNASGSESSDDSLRRSNPVAFH